MESDASSKFVTFAVGIDVRNASLCCFIIIVHFCFVGRRLIFNTGGDGTVKFRKPKKSSKGNNDIKGEKKKKGTSGSADKNELTHKRRDVKAVKNTALLSFNNSGDEEEE